MLIVRSLRRLLAIAMFLLVLAAWTIAQLRARHRRHSLPAQIHPGETEHDQQAA
jgi:hypothetical protein